MLALNDQLLSHLFTDVDIHGHEEEDDSINACEPSSHGSTSTSAHPGKGPHHHETNKSKSPLVHLLHGALAFTFLAGIIAGYHCIVNNGISNGNDSDGNDHDHDHGAMNMNMILGLKHFPFEILHAAETETATLHGYHSYFQFHQQQDMTESSPMDRFPFTVAALGVISCIFLYDTVRHYWNRRNLYKYK